MATRGEAGKRAQRAAIADAWRGSSGDDAGMGSQPRRDGPFERDLALHVLDRLSVDEMPAAAMRALETGYDSLDLAALAGELPTTPPADVRDAFEKALRGLGIELPSRREAAEYLKRMFAREALCGARSPWDAAVAIVELHDEIRGGLPDEDRFGKSFGIADLMKPYRAVYYEIDRPDSPDREREILEALRRLAAESKG